MSAIDTASPELRDPAPAKTPRIWGLWGTLAWTIVLGAVLAASSFAAVFVYFMIRAPEQEPSLTELEALAGDSLMLALGSLMTMIPLVLTVWLAVRIAGHSLTSYLPLTRPTWRDVAIGLMGMIVLLAALDLLSYLLGHPLTPQVVIDAVMSASRRGEWGLLLVAVLVSAPVGEEIVFRGFLFRGIAESPLGRTGAVLMTSALFALIHTQYSWYYLGEIFLIGLALGIARALSGSTLLTIAMHSFHNAAATVQAYWLAPS